MASMDGIPVDKQQELLNSLQCPVCQEICPPPIHLCSNGHHTCSACRSKIKACPVCKTTSLTKTRCVSLEHIASLVRLKCPNTGCLETVTGDVFKSHVHEMCDFSPVACYCHTGIKCNGTPVELGNRGYEAHLKVFHNCDGKVGEGPSPAFEFIYTSNSLESTPDNFWRIKYMKQDEKLFLLNDLTEKGTSYYWVTIGDSKEAAGKYEAKLTYYSVMGQEKKVRCTFQIPVHSCRERFDQVMASGDLAGIPEKILQGLAHKSSKAGACPAQRKRPSTTLEWRIIVRISLKTP